jgi:hypothetical protein
VTEQPSPRLFGRKRQANVPGGRPHRHVVKTTPGEEAALLGLAHERGLTVPRLLIDSALSREGDLTLTERRQLAVELTEVRRLLANLANNANQVAKYANTEGAVPEWAAQVLEDYRALRPLINGAIDDLVAG